MTIRPPPGFGAVPSRPVRTPGPAATVSPARTSSGGQLGHHRGLRQEREKLRSGETVAAGPGVRPGLLGTAPNPGGGRVVTYHGWPLYTYLGDAAPGPADGQGADDDGGYWYVMRPSGQIVGN